MCADEDANALNMLVYGEIAGVDVPFPLDNPDACKDSNITCPVKKNQAYSYRNVIFVKTAYPSVRSFPVLLVILSSMPALLTPPRYFSLCYSPGVASLALGGLGLSRLDWSKPVLVHLNLSNLLLNALMLVARIDCPVVQLVPPFIMLLEKKCLLLSRRHLTLANLRE